MSTKEKLTSLASIREAIELIQSEVIDLKASYELDYQDMSAGSPAEYDTAMRIDNVEYLAKMLSSCETIAADMIKEDQKA